LRNALYILLTQPDIRESVNADRDKALNNFIEEVMRNLGSVQYRTRVANQDIELGGTQIKKDDVLVVVNAAANRDPKKYGCPAQVDLNRPTPRDHLAFNAGPRSCVGAALARDEMRIAIEAILDRLPDLRLDPEQASPQFTGLFTRSYQPLHVLFTAAKRQL
jgi:cytochrome P450